MFFFTTFPKKSFILIGPQSILLHKLKKSETLFRIPLTTSSYFLSGGSTKGKNSTNKKKRLKIKSVSEL